MPDLHSQALRGRLEGNLSGNRVDLRRRNAVHVFNDAVVNVVTLDVAVPDTFLYRIEQRQVGFAFRLQGR